MIRLPRRRSKSTMQARIKKMHSRVKNGLPPVQLLEWQLQSQIVTWLDVKRRQGLLEYFAVPNGAWLGGATPKQKAKVMQRLKVQGFRTGVTDLVILLAYESRTLWIELKRPEESTELEDDQLEWSRWLNKHNYHHCVFNDFGAAVEWIESHLRMLAPV